ncbi:hypothetical protein SAMN05421507_107103 [Lentzea jiangxiensis]|uniref:Uncharacterized protein n=2 Tax=Lentzea jiangxiensis TaxID=641025 RepID=A0A1H0RW63_9PSEU|nr:hypothetical protein SAMN05421507_107103 [Lentzea jiangxiensis]
MLRAWESSGSKAGGLPPAEPLALRRASWSVCSGIIALNGTSPTGVRGVRLGISAQGLGQGAPDLIAARPEMITRCSEVREFAASFSPLRKKILPVD